MFEKDLFKMKLILTVGISASGKTTWAETQKHCMVNINRDDKGHIVATSRLITI